MARLKEYSGRILLEIDNEQVKDILDVTGFSEIFGL